MWKRIAWMLLLLCGAKAAEAQVCGPYPDVATMNAQCSPTASAPNTIGVLANALYSINGGSWSIITSSFASQSYATGALTTLTSTPFGFRQSNKNYNVDAIYISALALACLPTNAMTLTLWDCNSDSTCATKTAVGQGSVTAAGQGFVATVNGGASSVNAGDWTSVTLTSTNLCTLINATLIANIHTTG